MRIYYLNTLSSPDLADQTILSYLAYLATTLQVNTAVIVACIPFLKPFMEAMSTGAYSSTLVPMNSAFEFGSKQGSKQNINPSINSWRGPQAKTSYKMESMIDVGPPGARGHSTRPEIDTDIENKRESSQDDFNFAVSDSHAELGTLSSGKVVVLNRIRPALESRKSSVGSEKMMFTRATEWNVQKTYCKSNDERTMKSDGSNSQSIDKQTVFNAV